MGLTFSLNLVLQNGPIPKILAYLHKNFPKNGFKKLRTTGSSHNSECVNMRLGY